MRKTACIAHRLDYVFSPEIKKRTDLYWIVFEGSPDAFWLKKVLPQSRIISCRLKRRVSLQEVSDLWLLKHTDICYQLRINSITHLVLSHQACLRLENLARAINLQLVGPISQITQTFENKIWFQKFMDDNGMPSPPHQILSRIKDQIPSLNIPCVLQSPVSFGSFGTHLCFNRKSIESLLNNSTINNRSRFLVRRYISGKTYGISIIVESRLFALSALRIQCFYPGPRNVLSFAGIQWIPTSTFSTTTVKRIEGYFSALANKLQSIGHFGLFHFDFIVDKKGDVFILECNPRLSSATLQLHSIPDLFGGSIKPSKLFFESRSLSRSQETIPPSSYNGALLDIVPRKNIQVKHVMASGYYDKKLIHEEEAVESRKKDYFLHMPSPIGARFSPSDTAATIVSDSQLFSLSGTPLRLTNNLVSTILRKITAVLER